MPPDWLAVVSRLRIDYCGAKGSANRYWRQFEFVCRLTWDELTLTKDAGVRFCEYLPRLAARADRFAVVRTMHHTAGREFRNEHNSCMYLLHTGTTELPPGDTNATIAGPRAGRFEWPSIGSLLGARRCPEIQPTP